MSRLWLLCSIFQVTWRHFIEFLTHSDMSDRSCYLSESLSPRNRVKNCILHSKISGMIYSSHCLILPRLIDASTRDIYVIRVANN